MHLRAVTKLGGAVLKHKGRVIMGSDMAQYRLENILTQEIPDGLLMDIAYHWQANDNLLLDTRSVGGLHRDHSSSWEVPVSKSGFKSPPH
jgi:hypothetical protein